MLSPFPLRLQINEGVALINKTIKRMVRYLRREKYKLTPGPNCCHDGLDLKGENLQLCLTDFFFLLLSASMRSGGCFF